MKMQAIETQAQVIDGVLLASILEGVDDLYEQMLLEPPNIDNWVNVDLPDGGTDWALPLADAVGLMGRAALIRAQLAAGMSVPKHPCWG